MLWIVKFQNEEGVTPADMVVDAADADAALELLGKHGADGVPSRVIEIPEGVFCAEVQWADADDELDDDDEPDPNPANLSDGGVVLVPSDPLADFLELEANASSVLDVAKPKEGGT